jgi:outer membrane protein TolC
MHATNYTAPPALSQKLEQIETVKLETLSKTEPVTVQQATSNLIHQIEQPVDTAEQVELSLEQVRAATLENNLQLKVDLLSPAVSQTYVDEEQAKFEAVFFGAASHQARESSDHTVDTFTTGYSTGIEKPLFTGGSLKTEFSLDDTDATDDDGLSTSSATVSYIQPLLRGAGIRQNRRSILSARINRNIADARTKFKLINLLANADAAYWMLYAAQKELEVRQEQYRLAENQLNYARKKVAAGAAARIEIVRAEAGVASRLETVINAESRVENQQRSLRRIMNRPDLPVYSGTRILPQTHPNPLRLELDRSSLIQHALDNRMDLIQLDLQVAINEMEIASARNRTLPDLNLIASYSLSGDGVRTSDSYNTLTGNGYDSTFVGLTLQIPLGNRADRARLCRAQLERLANTAERKEREQFIRQQVLDTVSEFETSWRRILATEQGVKAAERDYHVEESQFQLGVRTSTDVLQANTRLADAKLARIRAFADYEIAQINLAFVTGTLLGYEKIMIPHS